jgi:hypothetical protein
MNKVIKITNLGSYKLLLEFQDGELKVIDFGTLIGKGISKSLLDLEYFNQVKIDDAGGIYWPNGFDFCPNFLKDYVLEDLAINS